MWTGEYVPLYASFKLSNTFCAVQLPVGADRGSNIVKALAGAPEFTHFPCLQHVMHTAVCESLSKLDPEEAELLVSV